MGQMFEVVCRNNHGLEGFDRNVEYMAEIHKNYREMLWVYDKFGKRREVFRKRFRTVKTVVRTMEEK